MAELLPDSLKNAIELALRGVTPSPLVNRQETTFMIHGIKRSKFPLPVDALEAGRGRIVDHGWKKDSLGDSTEGYCTVGGMVAEGAVTIETLEYLAKAAGLESWKQLDQWNDDPERTKGEVLDAYEIALKLAREDAS